MGKFLKKGSFVSILTSLVILAVGVLMICNPDIVTSIVGYVIGGVFVVLGAYKVINYFVSKGKYDFYNYDLVYGILAIVLGIIVMLCMNSITSLLRIMIGIWILYSGLLRLTFSFKLKKFYVDSWVFSLVASILMIVAGLFVTLYQGTILVALGFVMVFCSIMDIIEEIIFMKNVDKLLKHSAKCELTNSTRIIFLPSHYSS